MEKASYITCLQGEGPGFWKTHSNTDEQAEGCHLLSSLGERRGRGKAEPRISLSGSLSLSNRGLWRWDKLVSLELSKLEGESDALSHTPMTEGKAQRNPSSRQWVLYLKTRVHLENGKDFAFY